METLKAYFYLITRNNVKSSTHIRYIIIYQYLQANFNQNVIKFVSNA